jgi:hypothetical protein
VLTVAEVQAILDACTRLRDRFLLAVLHEGGMFSGARPCGGALFPAFAQLRG